MKGEDLRIKLTDLIKGMRKTLEEEIKKFPTKSQISGSTIERSYKEDYKEYLNQLQNLIPEVAPEGSSTTKVQEILDLLTTRDSLTEILRSSPSEKEQTIPPYHLKKLRLQNLLVTTWTIYDLIADIAISFMGPEEIVMVVNNNNTYNYGLKQIIDGDVKDKRLTLKHVPFLKRMKDLYGNHIRLAYKLRNIFMHNGGYVDGKEGSLSLLRREKDSSQFIMDQQAWNILLEKECGDDKCKEELNAIASNKRPKSLDSKSVPHEDESPGSSVSSELDLIKVLEFCHDEIDKAILLLTKIAFDSAKTTIEALTESMTRADLS